MLVLDELRYSEEHVWVRRDGEHTVTLGMTDYAQLELGELNYVELLNEGDHMAYCEPFGSVECARIVTDLYAPLGGKVVEINRDVLNNPKLINFYPYSQGWIVRAKLKTFDELDELMSSDDYEEYVLANSP